MRLICSGRTLRLLTAFFIVNLLLLGPQWILNGGIGPGLVALESFLFVCIFSVAPRNWGRIPLGIFGATCLVFVSIIAFADAVTRQSVGRPLNLYLDVHLISAVNKLLLGTFGRELGALLIAALILTILLSILILTYLLISVEDHSQKLWRHLRTLSLFFLFCFGLAGHELGLLGEWAKLPAVEITTNQTQHFFRMLNEKHRFTTEMKDLPDSFAATPNILGKLANRDVILAFIESYGMATLTDKRFSSVVIPRLNRMELEIENAGLHLATGRLEAPTQGGQSWLSHGSMSSGLWLDNQLRYDLMIASGRDTLIDDFRKAGHHTVALMPAITLAWPEGERLRYDQIYARHNIDYAGPSLNWVTMPDQFTWHFLQNTILRAAHKESQPVFAEVGLISSHAPWTPILSVLDDWGEIGDGSIFDMWKNSGESPRQLWKDMDRVRSNYALSVDYALQAMVSYAVLHVDESMLLIALGDHQAARLIIGNNANRTVPVHVVSGDSRLLQPFYDWGFKSGAFPDANRTPPKMDAFRKWFVHAFTEDGPHKAIRRKIPAKY